MCVYVCANGGEGGDKACPSTTDSTHPVEGKRTGRSHAGWKTKEKKQNMKKKEHNKKENNNKNKKGACVCAYGGEGRDRARPSTVGITQTGGGRQTSRIRVGK